MQLIKSKTYLNLAKAYAGECQARTRYDFIEYGARQEGYEAMANLIKIVSTNEFNHARMYYTYLQKANSDTIENVDIASGYPFREKWNLLDNLKFASQDEDSECSAIYPEYARIATEEGFPEIAELFSNVASVELCHKKLFKQLYSQLKNGTMYKKPQEVKWKCCGCGYEDERQEAWQVCPLCQAKQGFVMLKIEDNA